MELETAHIWKKINYFVFDVFFFLFADDDVKRNDFIELYFTGVIFLKGLSI